MSKQQKKKLSIVQIVSKLGVLGTLLVLVVVLSLITDQFMTTKNLLNVSRQVVVTAITGIGVTFVIIGGGIDLSIGSLLALSAVLSAEVMFSTNSVVLAILTALLSGMLLGGLQGVLITKFQVPPFAITLGGMSIFRVATMLITGGIPLSNLPDGYRVFGAGKIGSIAFPTPVLILIVFAVIAYFILEKTKLGRYIFALGSNENTTRLSGINVEKYRTITYMISGLCCGLAGILLTGRINSANPSVGEGFEMNAIAAAVIGGTSMSGGEGTIYGTIIGALVIQTIQNGLNLLQINAFWQNVAIGTIIIIAIIIDHFRVKMLEKVAD